MRISSKILFPTLGLFLAAAGLSDASAAFSSDEMKDVPVEIRFYQGFRSEGGSPSSAVSTFYLDPQIQGMPDPASAEEEAERIRHLYGLTRVVLKSEAQWVWPDRSAGPMFRLFVLDEARFTLLARGGADNESNLQVFAGERLDDPDRNLLDLNFELPERQTVVFGFNDLEGNAYFVSVRRRVRRDAPEDRGRIMAAMPRVVRTVEPPYPKQALQEGKTGDVILEGEIEESGRVSKVKTWAGDPSLVETARAAFRQWTFSPYSREKLGGAARMVLIYVFVREDEAGEIPDASSQNEWERIKAGDLWPRIKADQPGARMMVNLWVVKGRNEAPRLSGPYLGQEPPGLTPRIFAPEFVSGKDHEFSCTMNPEATEFYFARGTGDRNRKSIMVTRLQDGAWTPPAPARLDVESEAFEPHITPDGHRMYFMGFKTKSGGGMPDIDMFYTEREGEGWGAVAHLGAPFNPARSMFASVTRSGTIYTVWTEIMETEKRDDGTVLARPVNSGIVRSRPVDGGYSDYDVLGPPLEGKLPRMYPFVDPDESYLLFVVLRDPRGQERDLMVSFRTENGLWGEPRRVDLGMPAGCPFVSRDGKYLFFTSGRPGDIYWASSKVFLRLRPDEPGG